MGKVAIMFNKSSFFQVYVKMEKVAIMVMLCSERNCDQVLQEFKDYAQSPDTDFARKAIRCIGEAKE